MSQTMIVALSVGVAITGGAAAMFAYAYRLERKAHLAAVEWARASELGHKVYKQGLDAIYDTLETSNGGVGKRIAECREIAEAIFTQAPATFEQETGLIHWIQATDRFLVELDQLAPQNPIRAHVANSRSAEIYQRIHRAIGTPEVQG